MSEVEQDYADYASARWPNLVRSAIFLGCDPHDAEDLAQATLVRCFLKWNRVRRADDRDAYVFRMLVNQLRDSRRRRWHGETPAGDVPEAADPADIIAQAETSLIVRGALADLGAANREAVVLRYFVGLSERQTASALGIPAGTVKSRCSRALSQLAEHPHLAGTGGRVEL